MSKFIKLLFLATITISSIDSAQQQHNLDERFGALPARVCNAAYWAGSQFLNVATPAAKKVATTGYALGKNFWEIAKPVGIVVGFKAAGLACGIAYGIQDLAVPFAGIAFHSGKLAISSMHLATLSIVSAGCQGARLIQENRRPAAGIAAASLAVGAAYWYGLPCVSCALGGWFS